MIRLRTVALFVALVLLPRVAAPAPTATRITCTAAATTLFANTADSVARRILVRNPTASSIYVGPATLTNTTGFEVVAGAAVSVVLEPNDTLYCITDGSSLIVHTLVSRY